MKGDPSFIEEKVKSSGWIFSKIDGDPVLGRGIKCYATYICSAEYPQKMIVDWITATHSHFVMLGCNVIRSKVELVVFDTKKVKGI